MRVSCPNQCGQAGLMLGLDERSLREHLTRQCTHRPTSCPRGCGRVVPHAQLRFHDGTCPRNTSPCPNGCFPGPLFFACTAVEPRVSQVTLLEPRRVPAHVANDCPNTLFACALCNVAVKRCERDKHRLSDRHQLREAQDKIRTLTSAVTALMSKTYADSDMAAKLINQLHSTSHAFPDHATPLTAAEMKAAVKEAADHQACCCHPSRH